MLQAGDLRTPDPTALGGVAALGRSGLSKLTRASRCWQPGGEEARPHAALATEEPSLNGRCRGWPAALPRPRGAAGALPHKPRAARSHHSIGGRDSGHTLQPSFPQTKRLPGYSPARFSKEVQEEEEGGGGETLTNSLRTREGTQRRSREGGKEAHGVRPRQARCRCCWQRRGRGVRGKARPTWAVGLRQEGTRGRREQ